MGNCCTTRKESSENALYYTDEVLQKKLIKKISDNKLHNEISILRSERFDNICFAVIYGFGTTAGVIILFFSPEPTIAISSFLMGSSLVYYIKKTITNEAQLRNYINEIERRETASIKVIDNGKIYISK